jgi:hypothetical protein
MKVSTKAFHRQETRTISLHRGSLSEVKGEAEAEVEVEEGGHQIICAYLRNLREK